MYVYIYILDTIYIYHYILYVYIYTRYYIYIYYYILYVYVYLWVRAVLMKK